MFRLLLVPALLIISGTAFGTDGLGNHRRPAGPCERI